MLSHERVWAAIDALASRHGLHTSRLDSQGRSRCDQPHQIKACDRKGREHWPSTESIPKILDVTGAPLKDFLRLIEPSGSLRRSMIPLIGIEEAACGKVFTEDGVPGEGPGRDAMELPNVEQEKVFALAVTGDALSPLYGDGDTSSSRRQRAPARATGRRVHDQWRDPGQGTQAPLGQDPHNDVPCQGRGSGDPGRGDRLDRSDHVGTAIALSASCGSGDPVLHDAPGFTCLEVQPSRMVSGGPGRRGRKCAVSGLSALTKKLPRRGVWGRELAPGRSSCYRAELRRPAKFSASNAATLGSRGSKVFSV